MKNPIIIKSRKIDGDIDKSWNADLISEDDQLFTLVGIFDKEIRHGILGVIGRGTVSYEYYWKNCWFNVFRFHEPSGELRNFYCNVNMPPTFKDGFLDYVDLDIDVLVEPDFSYRILDLDEFETNTKKYQYSEYLRSNAQEALQQLLEMIEQRRFPFDYQS